MVIKIAVLLTCFNRKVKTVRCLESLFKAEMLYNRVHNDNQLCISVYLTDDACTDGTVDAVREVCMSRDFHLIQGNGHSYWAGGMRLAWAEALKKNKEWDFYLLLNDDTIICDNVFDELFLAHHFALANTNKPGIYSGVTSDLVDLNCITYSGSVYENVSKGLLHKAMPTGKPQKVDVTNANILLIPNEIVNEVGIFNKDFIHSDADYDYSMMVARHGYAAFITANVCGRCEYDHKKEGDVIYDLRQMSFKERYKYVNNPVHCDHDYLLYLKRNIPHKYYISWLLRKVRLFSPSIYAKICYLRGIEDYK